MSYSTLDKLLRFNWSTVLCVSHFYSSIILVSNYKSILHLFYSFSYLLSGLRPFCHQMLAHLLAYSVAVYVNILVAVSGIVDESSTH